MSTRNLLFFLKARTVQMMVITALIVAVIASMISVALMQIDFAASRERAQIELITRELTASAQSSDSGIRSIKVYHNDYGTLVASWTEGSTFCADIPILDPEEDMLLYHTDRVKSGSGNCTSSDSSSGIGNKKPAGS
ncbi:MAG: hypothetical protein WCP56_01830 [Candidatus Saccharibacteria bacterium]